MDEIKRQAKVIEIRCIVPYFKYFNISNKGLEIGAGDGFQSDYLKTYCKFLVSSEYNQKRLKKTPIPGISYLFCDAENLPICDNAFNWIYSSNVLEHVRNRGKALSEFGRCINDKGIMLHILPNRVWRVSSVLFYYPMIIKSLICKIFHLDRRHDIPVASNIKSKMLERKLINRIFPPRHGEYRSVLQEFIEWGEKRWIKYFDQNGWKVIACKRIPFYSCGYSISLRRIGTIAGLRSTTLYVMKKKI